MRLIESERDAARQSNAAAAERAAEAERAFQMKSLQFQLEMTRAQVEIERSRREQLQLELEILRAKTDAERAEKQAAANRAEYDTRKREENYAAAVKASKAVAGAVEAKDDATLDEMSKGLMVIPR